MPKIYNDITEMIGNIPLVYLHRTAVKHGAQIWRDTEMRTSF